MSMEAGDYAFYEANELNQYTDITGSEDETDFTFTPAFDADGNQTSIKTETGIRTAVYNAENRPSASPMRPPAPWLPANRLH